LVYKDGIIVYTRTCYIRERENKRKA